MDAVTLLTGHHETVEAVRDNLPDVEDDALEAPEEHRVATLVLAEIDGIGPEHERFPAKMIVLTPPGNLAADAAAALLDKPRDAGRKAAKTARTKAAARSSKSRS